MENNNLIYEQRPWLTDYAPGIAVNINPEEFPNAKIFIETMLSRYADEKGFYNMGKWLTFKQVDILSRDLAAYLHYRGLKPGDRIAIMAPNILQSPIAIFAALRAGLIIVNTNPLYTPREMKHQFADSGAKAIIIADMFAANLEKIIGETQIEIVIKTSIGELLGGLKGSIVDLVVKHVKKMVPNYNLPNAVSFNTAIAHGKKYPIQEFTQGPDDVIFLQYTGGTTGVSKGAMLTNRNIISNMLMIKTIMQTVFVEKQETILTALPLYHIFALTVNLMTMISFGVKNVLVTNARDLKSVIKEFNTHKISVFTGVNTLFNALLHNDDFQKLDFSNFKVVVAGGMALQEAVARKWKEVTGVTIAEGYGLTESSPVASVNPIDGRARIGTIGVPVSSTYMRIVNDEGQVLGVEEVGEIQIKGPQIMKGYFNRQDETDKVLKDGWLSTGDIGMMFKDGYFKIVDRKKDMILVSGFNVYPNEIEDVIAMMPKVVEVAAIGVPHEKSGETIKVFIVKKDSSLTDHEVIEYCRKNLTNYKVPKFVEFRDSLPKSNVGKILRRILKEEEMAKNK
ncbi:MAG: AMP-binding protein [Saprospiraceae bacterium]|nr:AMP-binding protein [Saprospiraceae bacterium]